MTNKLNVAISKDSGTFSMQKLTAMEKVHQQDSIQLAQIAEIVTGAAVKMCHKFDNLTSCQVHFLQILLKEHWGMKRSA